MTDRNRPDGSDALQASLFQPGPPVPVSVPIRARGLNQWEERTASRVGDTILLEGDIRIDPPDGSFDRGLVERGLGWTGDLWLDGVVIYEISGADAGLVAAAIRHWETRTAIRFREDPSAFDRLSFIDAGACWSYVGRTGGPQLLSLNFDCALGSAIHEIGHAVGLWHEQSRKDRDAHVEIVTANILPDQRHNFEQHILDGIDLGTYDYGSIMHYPPLAFSRNDEPTIIPRNGQVIGQRDALSPGDIAAVRLLYPDLDWDTVAPDADGA